MIQGRSRPPSSGGAPLRRGPAPATEPTAGTDAAVAVVPPRFRLPVVSGAWLTATGAAAWLVLLVVVPLGALVLRALSSGPLDLLRSVLEPRMRAALRLSVGSALLAALLDLGLGLLLAWVLVRRRFPGRRLLDALIEVPLALPTAVAGIALTAIYAPSGWAGRLLAELGWKVAYAPAGVVVAMAFVGLPFTVRTVQSVLAALDPAVEEAAGSLGATRWQTLRMVTLPLLAPALRGGFAMSFARALGEYGSVVFIAGNLPFRTETAPLLVVARLEQFDYDGAAALGVVLLVVALTVLLGAHALGHPVRSSGGAGVLRAPSDRHEPWAWLSRLLPVVLALGVFALVVLAPLVEVGAQAAAGGASTWLRAVVATDTLAAVRLTLLATAIAVPVNTVCGVATAWVLARCSFPGRRFVRALVEVPIAVSPVVAGLLFVLLFGRGSLLGTALAARGVHVLFALPAVVLATLFVTIPLVAHEVLPALEAASVSEEEAAQTLGATGWQAFWHVTLPKIRWALLYGVLQCTARAMGEFGAVSVVSGRIQGHTETLSLRIQTLYDLYDLAGAFAVASLLAAFSLATLFARSLLERKKGATP